MRTIYLLIGGLCLSFISMSCDADDHPIQEQPKYNKENFQQEIQPEDSLTPMSKDVEIKPTRGDEDEDTANKKNKGS